MTPRRLPRPTRRLEAPLLFESFFVAAVCSFLGIRAFLALANYPQVGGGGLHIAHMLWGGLLMLVALLLLLGFLDATVFHAAAIVAGLGFGTFIDEIGKFVTSDNDYFFRPAVALIYVAFVGAFLLTRTLIGTRRLDPRESLANALDRLEGDFDRPIDPDELVTIRTLLRDSDPGSPLAVALGRYVTGLPTRPDTDSAIETAWTRLSAVYADLLERPWFDRALTIAIVLYTAASVVGVGAVLLATGALALGSGAGGPLSVVATAEGVSTVAGAALVMIGVTRLRRSRLAAYRWFIRGLLVWILVTQVFVFYASQLAGVGGLAVDLAAYGSIRFAIRRETVAARPRDG
jgi:hypothetical protein